MCIRDRGRVLNRLFFYFRFVPFGKLFSAQPQPRTHTGSSTGPVSYTHLDVYKRQVLRRASSLKEGAFGRMEHLSFSPEPPSVRKTPPAGRGGTKVPEGEWVASRSDDGRSFFLSHGKKSLQKCRIPVAFCLGG